MSSAIDQLLNCFIQLLPVRDVTKKAQMCNLLKIISANATANSVYVVLMPFLHTKPFTALSSLQT